MIAKDFHAAAVRAGWTRGQRYAWDQVVALKDHKTTVGEPYDSLYSNFEDFIKRVGAQVAITAAEVVLRKIEDGEDPYVPCYRVFLKYDKHSTKKIESGNWRLINATDFIMMFLQLHVLGPFVAAESVHPRVLVHVTPRRWREIIVQRIGSRKTSGIDFSDYDETESASVIYALVLRLAECGGAPENLSKFFARASAFTWIVDKAGNLVEKAGGNGSGQWLTSTVWSMR